MAVSSSFLSLSLCLLVFCHAALAQFGYSSRSFAGQRGCRFDRLDALNPSQSARSEAGITEYYDENNEMLQCAGVSVRRHIIQPRGLVLPQYNNAPSLVYIVQGRGIAGTIFPGCPETYQSFQQQSEQLVMGSESQSQQRMRDEHQKVHRYRQGDIIAKPAGVTHWCYNDGDVPVVAVEVFDTSNTANQLEPRRRSFYLAGRHQTGQQKYEAGQQQPFAPGQLSGNNILNGFDTQMLAEALGVNPELARRLQSQNDQRGEIVYVRQGLQLQGQAEAEAGMQRPQECGESMQGQYNITNGLDEIFCTRKIRTNIDDPDRADQYNRGAGRLTRVNSQKLPILNLVQMSATRVVLQRNAMITPYCNMNCHSVMYVTGGQGRVQVVDHQGRRVFDGILRQGQILLIPQNYAVLKRAEHEGFHWVSFNTNNNAMINQMVGKYSTLRAMPLQVLMNSYRLSIEQARRLKFNRGYEMTILSPRSETMERRSTQ